MDTKVADGSAVMCDDCPDGALATAVARCDHPKCEKSMCVVHLQTHSGLKSSAAHSVITIANAMVVAQAPGGITVDDTSVVQMPAIITPSPWVAPLVVKSPVKMNHVHIFAMLLLPERTYLHRFQRRPLTLVDHQIDLPLKFDGTIPLG